MISLFGYFVWFSYALINVIYFSRIGVYMHWASRWRRLTFPLYFCYTYDYFLATWYIQVTLIVRTRVLLFFGVLVFFESITLSAGS